jgi:hypothetical protein
VVTKLVASEGLQRDDISFPLKSTNFGVRNRQLARLAYERKVSSHIRPIERHSDAHDDLANAAMGAVVMCGQATPANFSRKIVYQNLGIV